MPGSLISGATAPVSTTVVLDNLQKYYLVVGDAQSNTDATYVIETDGSGPVPGVSHLAAL